MKYGNRRTVIDGIAFDSAAEGRRYVELRLLERAGQITDLELQPRFPLVVRDIRVATYVGDFRYRERGATIVEDVKSEPTKTPIYRLKKRLLLALYGIVITEVEA